MPRIEDANYPEGHVWVYDPEKFESRLVPIEDADKPLGDDPATDDEPDQK